ncbi:mitochondrial import receptor subunit TOM40 homolog 1-like [Tubulanus polymorphus]|uniref:mitochondrial import receptor subunit TOM40 homolog 1-like n=1 Tax=Tubulanus polymorphus TaxID=672921 RepID=UPI003DA6487E
MGNVMAAGVPGAAVPPPPPGMAPPPPSTGAPPPAPAATSVEETLDTNPKSFEELHRKCKEVFPTPFEGAKLLINKGLSNHFQISHTLTMSSLQPSGYRFGCTYVGTKSYGPAEVFPVLIGDIDPSGNLNANIIHQFSENIRCKFMSQIQGGKMVTSQLSTDYRGKDFTASVTLGNIDIVNESGIVVSQYLQNVTSKLALGAELLYQYGPQVPGSEITVLTLAGRYLGKNWQLSSNICPAAGGAHACYYHKINDNLHVGLELEGSLRMQECTATAGYQYEIPKANLTFRGQLDTNWCIGAVLEKQLQPLPFTLAISAYANQVKAMYKFGIGLIVG